jgi:hypothetical protein
MAFAQPPMTLEIGSMRPKRADDAPLVELLHRRLNLGVKERRTGASLSNPA